ncbi:ester cyclase [Nocardia sp. NPDC051030]|uniref:ester cyclase n=1 Tax=Nocardia sp. NPDC051030 TaxID=3155162 RepID=UPI00341B2E68
MSSEQVVKQNMVTFGHGDRSWNARTQEFIESHTEDVVVYQPGSHEPRVGRHDHWGDMEGFWSAFSDITIGPVGPEGIPMYKEQFGSGDKMCGVSVMTGTHTGTLNLFGLEVPPTGKKVDIELCTVATFKDGKIAEERLYYDMLLLAMDLGVWPPK